MIRQPMSPTSFGGSFSRLVERAPRNVIVLTTLALAAAVVAHVLLNLAISSGGLIPQDDLTSDYATGVVWAAALGLGLWLWPLRKSDRAMLAIAWLAKAMVTLVFMLLYEANYDLDAYEYFAGPRRRAVVLVVWIQLRASGRTTSWPYRGFSSKCFSGFVSRAQGVLYLIYRIDRRLSLLSSGRDSLGSRRGQIESFSSFLHSVRRFCSWSSILGEGSDHSVCGRAAHAGFRALVSIAIVGRGRWLLWQASRWRRSFGPGSRQSLRFRWPQ